MKSVLQFVMTFLLVAVTARIGPAAETYNNSNALTGVRETKVYFDVNVGEPAKLLNRLQLIDATYDQLVAAGISPLFVVGIRGKASNYFTRGDDYVLDTDLPVKRQIEAGIDRFKARHYRLEQCYIAAGLQDIDVVDFLPQLEVVASGYVSMIGYQSKGYAFVPMD
jgi:hypothetical protein